MDHRERVDAVEREVRALVDALSRAPRDAPVPTCPGWTLSDLTGHVGEFCGLWAHVLAEAAGRDKSPFTALTDGDDLGAWLEAAAGRLVHALRETEADDPCWTWVADEQRAGFVARRAADELAFHRYDAQTASGSASPLDAGVAADAIEEAFVMLPAWGNPPEGSGLSLHLHGEEGGEWTITLAPSGPQLASEHAPADLTLAGTASDLALLLYQRPTVGSVTREGDPRALEAWYREFLFG